MIGAG
ncbi:hypothetical protein HaLaN_20768, partial [Haematococcus lacustris]|jgi:hypothetical protein